MQGDKSLVEWSKSILDSQERLNIELDELNTQLRGWWEEAIRERTGIDRAHLLRIIPQDHGIGFEYEYNDACNCHPEYITATFLVPYNEIDRGIEHQIKLAKGINEKREKEQRELRQRQEEDRIKRQRDGELALLKSLKEKYER